MLPPAFSLALQAPMHAQGQLVSTRQTGNLAFSPPLGQVVDRQNGLLHSQEMLWYQHPPSCTEWEAEWQPQTPGRVPLCRDHKSLCFSLFTCAGDHGAFWVQCCDAPMILLHLFLWRDLRPKELAFFFFFKHNSAYLFTFLVMGRHRLAESKSGFRYQQRQSSALCGTLSGTKSARLHRKNPGLQYWFVRC